jgi:site-specific recombinase XerD
MARLGHQAGFERRVHAHALRHSFAIQAVRAGLALPIVQAALRHASLATTDTYLRHVAPADSSKR